MRNQKAKRGQPYLGTANRSDRWYIYFWKDGKRQRLSTGYIIGAEDAEAQQCLAAFILEQKHPTGRTPGNLTIKDILDDYWEEHAQFVTTAKRIEENMKPLRNYFEPGTVEVISPASTRAYARERMECGISAATVIMELARLKAALNHSYKENRLIRVPAIVMPSRPKPRQKYLNKGQLQQLLDACQTVHVYAYIMLAIHTGQRPGAIESLRWFDIDFSNRIIWYPSSNNNKRRNPVPMTPALHDMLEDMYRHKDCEYVLSWRKERAGCVKKAIERAAINAGFTGVSRYTLRHSCANLLLAQGVPLEVISEILGHGDISTTKRNYIKNNPALIQAHVERLQLAQ